MIVTRLLSPRLCRRRFVGTTLAATVGCMLPAGWRGMPLRTHAATHHRAGSILLHSGWDTRNIGDIGHTPGTLRYLTEHLPEARISCWLEKTSPAVTDMLRARFPGVSLITEGRLQADGTATTPALQAAFDGSELFIRNSGMPFTRWWPPPVAALQACIARQKPFGLYGQTFDGFREQDAAELPGLLSRAAFIFCRDNESLRFLREAGVKPGVLEFGPDGCFGIDVRDDVKAAAFLREHDLEPRRFLAVVLRTDKHTVATPTDRGERPVAGSAEWGQKLREVITDWVQRTGLRAVLVPEVDREIGPAKELILDRLPDAIRRHVVHRETFWNADEAVSFYSQAHSLVAVEPHSCIMALAVGTPMIHFFTRQHGTKAFMFRDIGLPEWLIDIDVEPAARVSLELNRIHDDHEFARAKARRAMQFVSSRSAEMAGVIRDVLDS